MNFERPDGSVIGASTKLLGHGRTTEVHAVFVDGTLMAAKVFSDFQNNASLIRDAIERAMLAGHALTGMSQQTLRVAPALQPIIARTEAFTTPAVLMPLADGATLGDWLAAQPTLYERLIFLQRLLTGLGDIHSNGVTHNDLSFGNVLVGSEPWLIDFDRAGNQPRPLERDSVFYTKDGFGIEHDLCAFAILACIMVVGRHPFAPDLPSLIAGRSSLSEHVLMPEHLGWAQFLRPALELADGLRAEDLCRDWPSHDQ